MKLTNQELIKALRSTPSRSKRALLDTAADKIEELQAENYALVRNMLYSEAENQKESELHKKP